MSKISDAWEKIFLEKKFDTALDTHFISAKEIKRITGVEARIMAKVDASVDLPDIFKANGYFLLPVKNGEYVIVRGEGFHQLEKLRTTSDFTSRIKFNMTTAARGQSEMQYLDYSFYSGALESIFGVSPLYQSIRGREYSRDFSFKVNKNKIDVRAVQIEVDSGLEGEDRILLIEAKVNKPKDFIVRQLFYPYKNYRLISPDKKIIPVFFTYEPDSKRYNFWIYDFADDNDYNSLKLKEIRSVFIKEKNTIELKDIKPVDQVIYRDLIPQANDLEKVIELIFKVKEGYNHPRDISAHFDFTIRQSSYYRHAAEALGLIKNSSVGYVLTNTGEQLADLPTDKRNLFLIQLLKNFNLIKESLDILDKTHQITKDDLTKLILKNSSLGLSTATRRAASLFSWLKWIGVVTGAFVQHKKILSSHNSSE